MLFPPWRCVSEINPNPELEKLASCYGVLAEYWDIRGVRHETTNETRRSLLEAMGVACGSASEVAASLEDFRNSQKLHTAPTVLVVEQEKGVISFPLLFGPEEAYRYRIACEDGRELLGFLPRDDFEVLESFTVDKEMRQRVQIELELPLQTGYHQLLLSSPRTEEEIHSCTLIVVPPHCYLPPELRDGEKKFGLSSQLYSLRSERNWGVGDFSDLKTLLEIAAEQEAAFVGLNPLHAVAPRGAPQISPYNPASRVQLNPIYLDIAQAREFLGQSGAADADREDRLKELRESDLVQYSEVAREKFVVLESLYEEFSKQHLRDRRSKLAGEYHEFVHSSGEALKSYSLYAALQEYFVTQDPGVWGFPVWPKEYQDPKSEAVQAFYLANLSRVGFYQFVAWLCERQLADVVELSDKLELSVGLYLDIALGAASGGAEVWAAQDLYARGVSAGAPPDKLAPQGQNWGLPPLIPHRLTEAAYQPFIDVLRASMKYAGAVRIDHVMSLLRLYWVQDTSGAYVAYPLEDLIGILALESQRNQCLVIGEDLGTVPAQVREAMQEKGVLSYKVLYFEKDEGGDFLAPAEYPALSLVVTSTHDLPTLHGYCAASDLELRRSLALHQEEVQRELEEERGEDVRALSKLLGENGLWESGQVSDRIGPKSEINTYVSIAVHQALARSSSILQAVQLEDLLFSKEQMNLPGTVDEHPNWRTKLSRSLEQIRDDELFEQVLQRVRQERS